MSTDNQWLRGFLELVVDDVLPRKRHWVTPLPRVNQKRGWLDPVDGSVNHDDVFNDGDDFFRAVFDEEVELICVDKLEFHLKWNIEDWTKLGTSHGLAGIGQRWEIGQFPLMNAFDCRWNEIDTLSHRIKKLLKNSQTKSFNEV